MEPILIKVKKGFSARRKPEAQPEPEKKPQKFHLNRFWIFILCLAFLSETLFLIYKVYQPSSLFDSLIPPNAISVSYFDPASSLETLNSLKQAGAAWPPLDWATNAQEQLKNRDQVELAQIPALFKNKAVLVWLPTDPDRNNRPRWLLIGQIKNEEGLREAVNKAKTGLKQDYNLLSEDYRQIEITRIKPLSSEQGGVYFSQLKDYFCLASGADLIKKIIDQTHL